MQGYNVYLATDAAGGGKAQLGATLAAGTNQLVVSAGTSSSGYSQLVVFAESSLEEQTTPAALALVDTDSSVSSVAFDDLDLDAGEAHHVFMFLQITS